MTGREQVTLNAVNQKLDAFIERAEPMMEFYSAATTLLRWLKWTVGLTGGAAGTYLALHAAGIL